MAEPLLVVEQLQKIYYAGRLLRQPVFSLQAHFTLEAGRIVGVVGPNGAGKTTLFEIMTGSNTPTRGQVRILGTDIHDVKYRQRDRLAIHYHQSYQVRRFRRLVPSLFLRNSPTQRPLVHLFDEPQFNTADGYIGFMLDFFRRLRSEGKLVVVCLHPTARYHLEILREIAEEFLFVADGTVARKADFAALVADPRVRAYFGPQTAAAADTLI